jgi:hypothetical protein
MPANIISGVTLLPNCPVNDGATIACSFGEAVSRFRSMREKVTWTISDLSEMAAKGQDTVHSPQLTQIS